MTCGRCGAEVSGEFCSACGRRLGQNEPGLEIRRRARAFSEARKEDNEELWLARYSWAIGKYIYGVLTGEATGTLLAKPGAADGIEVEATMVHELIMAHLRARKAEQEQTA